jgi:hypothetical protein
MCGEFDQKLEILYVRIGLEVINVLDPFLAFAHDTFNKLATTHVCALQLHLKGLQCVMEYANKDKTKNIIEKYDEQVLVPFLMKIAKHLKSQCAKSLMISLTFVIHDSLWRVEVSPKEANLSWVKTKNCQIMYYCNGRRIMKNSSLLLYSLLGNF